MENLFDKITVNDGTRLFMGHGTIKTITYDNIRYDCCARYALGGIFADTRYHNIIKEQSMSVFNSEHVHIDNVRLIKFMGINFIIISHSKQTIDLKYGGVPLHVGIENAYRNLEEKVFFITRCTGKSIVYFIRPGAGNYLNWLIDGYHLFGEKALLNFLKEDRCLVDECFKEAIITGQLISFSLIQNMVNKKLKGIRHNGGAFHTYPNYDTLIKWEKEDNK